MSFPSLKLEKNCLLIMILLRLATDLPKKPIIGRISDFRPCLHIHDSIYASQNVHGVQDLYKITLNMTVLFLASCLAIQVHDITNHICFLPGTLQFYTNSFPFFLEKTYKTSFQHKNSDSKSKIITVTFFFITWMFGIANELTFY